MSAAQIEAFQHSDSKKADKSQKSLMLTDQRFKNTKSGVVGVQRDSMLENELHLLVLISLQTCLF
jgi:hypothetical protein